MRRHWLFLLVLLLLRLTVPALASEQEQKKAEQTTTEASAEETVEVSHPSRVRLGGISFYGAYHRFPSFYYPYGYYDPFWYPYYWGPFSAFGAGYTYGSAASGMVRLKTNVPEAWVFIDGALAGTAKELKRFPLEPGVYELKLTANGRQPFEQKIYVLSGKQLKISANLRAEGDVR